MNDSQRVDISNVRIWTSRTRIQIQSRHLESESRQIQIPKFWDQLPFYTHVMPSEYSCGDLDKLPIFRLERAKLLPHVGNVQIIPWPNFLKYNVCEKHRKSCDNHILHVKSIEKVVTFCTCCQQCLVLLNLNLYFAHCNISRWGGRAVWTIWTSSSWNYSPHRTGLFRNEKKNRIVYSDIKETSPSHA